MDDGAKDDWRNDHLDELDEAIAEWFERFAEFGPDVTHHNAQGNGQ